MCWQHSWEMIRWNLCRKKEELVLLRRPLTMTIIHEMMLTAPRSLRVECFFFTPVSFPTRETILLGNQVWHITKHSRFLLLKPTLIPLFLLPYPSSVIAFSNSLQYPSFMSNTSMYIQIPQSNLLKKSSDSQH